MKRDYFFTGFAFGFTDLFCGDRIFGIVEPPNPPAPPPAKTLQKVTLVLHTARPFVLCRPVGSQKASELNSVTKILFGASFGAKTKGECVNIDYILIK